MAQYKVPQDVEADDKLLGPFSFRQFVYLMIAGGLIALAVGLAQLFPLLAILPLPPVLFFLAMALPLKKDQPMETYLAAMLSYYLKPRTRIWMPGQTGTTVLITAPKQVEESRTRDITGEEATHRLSFLADIVDTEGYAIKGINENPMREDLVAEANNTVDMFESARFDSLATTIAQDERERHAEVVKQMQATINETENDLVAPLKEEQQRRQEEIQGEEKAPVKAETATEGVAGAVSENLQDRTEVDSGVATEESGNATEVEPEVVMPAEPVEKLVENSAKETKTAQKPIKQGIIDLANNDVFSVATIAEQAKRINKKEDGEVFISLH